MSITPTLKSCIILGVVLSTGCFKLTTSSDTSAEAAGEDGGATGGGGSGGGSGGGGVALSISPCPLRREHSVQLEGAQWWGKPRDLVKGCSVI